MKIEFICLGLAVILIPIAFNTGAKVGKQAGVELACVSIYSDLYRRLDVKNIDYDSLNKFCKNQRWE